MSNNIKVAKDGKKYYSYYKKVDKDKKYEYPINLLKNDFSVKEVLTLCKKEGVKISEGKIRDLKKQLKDDNQ